MWIASYRYSDKIYNFMVNGQTGKVQGEAPISWWKVALAVLIVLALLACIFGAMVLFGESAESTGMHISQPTAQWIALVLRSAASTLFASA